MNRQLLRLKQRSNGDVYQVAQCDDSTNIYVNVAESTPIEIDGGTVDEVSKSVSYLTDVNGVELPARGSLIGYTLTKEVQSSIQYSTEQSVTWAASSVQYTGKELNFTLPTGDIQSKYFVTIHNPSDQTNITMYVTNEQLINGATRSAAINNSVAFTVPKSANVLFSGTAWNSCFTSINGSLTDESGDINDVNVAGDVPFPFAAANDAIYFGASIPFDRIRLNIAQAANYVGVTTWEYWNGATWAALTVEGDTTNATVQTGVKSFTRTGWRSVSFDWPSDWVAYDITGDPVSAYWIRCRISSFTSATTTPTFSQGYYKRVAQPSVHSYLVEGVYGGADCKILLENDTALDAVGDFTATVLIKRL